MNQEKGWGFFILVKGSVSTGMLLLSF